MCIEPHLLCLDEPAAGLNAKESAELNKLLKFIKNDKNTGILLIEHDKSVVMEKKSLKEQQKKQKIAQKLLRLI